MCESMKWSPADLPMVFPGSDWQEAEPGSQGVDPTALAAAMAYLARELADWGGARSVTIVRNGYLIRRGPESSVERQLFSATKSFTSTVLGLLIEDGKASLDTLAADLLPELARDYPAVTLRHFATMTSGYDAAGCDYELDQQGRGDTWNPSPPAPPLFPPGTKFRYWDEAMMQFGRALTAAAGEPLDQLLRRRVADPIGMREWRWLPHPRPEVGLLNWTGGIFTTSRELARFGHLFLNRGRWGERQLVSASWVDQASTVQVPTSVPNDDLPRSRGSGSYGYNWWVNGVRPDGTRRWSGAPPRTYFANGLHSNVCAVVPEWNMVITRTNPPRSDWSVNRPDNIDEVYGAFFALLGEGVATAAGGKPELRSRA